MGSRSSTALDGRKKSNNCVPRSSRSRRLRLNPKRGRNDSHCASGRPIFFEVNLVLWKGINPYRNFDGKELASFKSGNFHGGTIMPRRDISCELG